MVILKNSSGASVTLLETGGAIQSVMMPDRNGVLGDVVLGCDDESSYPVPGCLGAMVGRFGNRIGGAAFTLNGEEYHITRNEGANTLHGGRGYHMRKWNIAQDGQSALLTLTDPDGSEGFPGTVEVKVRVTLTDENELILEYEAVSDRDTVINLTNHSYFNLAGTGTILDHELRFASDAYLEVDKALIPTGKIVDVTGTDFDFRKKRPIANGFYDHCFLLRDGDGVKADVYEKSSGRGMRMYTDQPSVQFYCGGGLRGVTGRNGVKYPAFGGFCLETQHYPDAPNHPEFPSTLLKAGERFTTRTVYAFYAE